MVCEKEGKMLCQICLERMKLTKQKCPRCCQQAFKGTTHTRCLMKQGMDGLVSVWNYRQREVQKVIKAVKYRFCREVVGEIFNGIDFEKMNCDLIVPLPLNKLRKNWRGFNQASIIAKELGQRWGIEVVDLLIRVKKTKPLAEMKNSKLRKAEIKGAFMVNKDFDLKNKRVLLVDDVFTSGATMREATKVLKRAGVKEVWGWTLAN